MIQCQLKVILAQREVEDKAPYTISELAQATGLTRQTLYNLANNVTGRYDEHVLDSLCQVLGVQVGDLLVYRPGKLQGPDRGA